MSAWSPSASLRQRLGGLPLPSLPQIGCYAAALIVPVALNVWLWRAIVAPQQRESQTWRDTEIFLTWKPKLTGSITESHRLVMDWQRAVFSSADPSAVMQTLRRLAGEHHVQMDEMNAGVVTRGEPAKAGGFSTMPLELKLIGSFGQLAHWMNAVEQEAGLQLEAWTITGAQEAGSRHQATVKLTALLRGA